MQPNPYKVDGKRICNPKGWYFSEKLDGMKGRWIDGKLVTRSCNDLNPPKWFRRMLPKDYNVEGELYFGKNTFHKTASLRSSAGLSELAWEKVEFHIFDIIDYELPFVQRKRLLKKIIEVNQFIKLVKWRKVESAEHVEEELKKIVDENGEGLILADPNGMYEDGHVDQILKYKPKKDREAEVIGYETNEDGSRLKSLVVRDRKITFHIGTGLKIKHRYGYKERFPIGYKVSYWYEILGKNGKPRTPIFKGVRVDLN
jgi:DNA ligase-1